MSAGEHDATESSFLERMFARFRWDSLELESGFVRPGHLARQCDEVCRTFPTLELAEHFISERQRDIEDAMVDEMVATACRQLGERN
jgi:hypothetical protein